MAPNIHKSRDVRTHLGLSENWVALNPLVDDFIMMIFPMCHSNSKGIPYRQTDPSIKTLPILDTLQKMNNLGWLVSR